MENKELKYLEKKRKEEIKAIEEQKDRLARIYKVRTLIKKPIKKLFRFGEFCPHCKKKLKILLMRSDYFGQDSCWLHFKCNNCNYEYVSIIDAIAYYFTGARY
jgi:hypothetical protein